MAGKIIAVEWTKTDKLFYRIFLSQPELISELLPGVPPDCEFEYNAPVDNPPSDAEFQRRLDLVEAILVNKFPQLSFEEVRQMLDLKEVNFSETRFYQDVLQKGLEQGLERGLEQGLEQGLERGLERGLRQGEGDLVLRLLQRRCGVLGVDQQDLIRSLNITQLEALGDALLDFKGMADLEAWLKINRSIS